MADASEDVHLCHQTNTIVKVHMQKSRAEATEEPGNGQAQTTATGCGHEARNRGGDGEAGLNPAPGLPADGASQEEGEAYPSQHDAIRLRNSISCRDRIDVGTGGLP